MTATSAMPTLWLGWFKPSGARKWIKAASGADYGTVLNQTLDATAAVGGKSAEVLVSRDNPNDKPLSPRRRCL